MRVPHDLKMRTLLLLIDSRSIDEHHVDDLVALDLALGGSELGALPTSVYDAEEREPWRCSILLGVSAICGCALIEENSPTHRRRHYLVGTSSGRAASLVITHRVEQEVWVEHQRGGKPLERGARQVLERASEVRAAQERHARMLFQRYYIAVGHAHRLHPSMAVRQLPGLREAA
ncbi:MAG: hypothetical protein AAGN46_01355 [Acidobacteriota bacterium]